MSINYQDLQENARGEHTRKSSEPITEKLIRWDIVKCKTIVREHLNNELTLSKHTTRLS